MINNQGSLAALVNEKGSAEYFSFDAWGRRRNAQSWTYENMPASFGSTRGFTMHEHLDEFKLINMNGRVYDPLVGRFLSPDPFVQMPNYSQSYNRYSYAFNNPLRFSDPSGFFAEGDSTLSPAQIPPPMPFLPGTKLKRSSTSTNTDNTSFGLVFKETETTLPIPYLSSKLSMDAEGNADEVTKGGGDSDFGKTVQSIALFANVADIFFSAAEQTIQTTKAGADFAFAVSGSNTNVNLVNNTIKYAPYVGLFVTVGTGSYLSIQKDPATGRPYQPWGETGIDIGVNITTMYIGSKYGGWYGAGAAAFYIGVKTNVQYQMNNGINPGVIFILNKE